MKFKTFSIALMATAALVGCQNQDENNNNNNDTEDPNVEQTRFNAGDANDQENRQDFDMNRDENDNNTNNEYDVSDEAAEKIANQVEGIDNAYVVTTENNAYVAAELDTNNNNNQGTNNNNNNNNGNGNGDGDELTDRTKQKITDVVKSVDNNIDNVYVSTNPDFLDLVTDYANQAENGEPIEGLFDQMGNMIERVFPQDNE